MNGKKLLVLLIVGALLLAALPVGAASVPPTIIPGSSNQGKTCDDVMPGTFELKIDPVPNGAYGANDGALSVNIVKPSTLAGSTNSFDWTSNLKVVGVIVKDGVDGANWYNYGPAGVTGDTYLTTPFNGDKGISHISFCYKLDVQVTKTVTTTFTRDWDWKISKTGDQTALTLSVGQQFLVNYEVTVETDGYTDSNWAVSGGISIYNPAPIAATITDVTDVISDGINASVVCGVTFPYVLAAKSTLNCTYSSPLPDGTDRTNTAAATTSGKVGGGSDTKDVTFGDPTTKVDECVAVSDTNVGDLGTVCAGDAPTTFNYSEWIGPYAVCGEYSFNNTASYVGGSGETGSASHSVAVTVPCATGCTLTQGYWKTHSEFGPAPYDNTWAQLPNGASTPFFLSGQTYYKVLWTPPAGNAYYNLAHQYIAAKLNQENGAAIPPAVLTAFNQATGLFGTYTPAQVALLKGNDAVRKQFVALATTLDLYNNGKLGVPHCSE